jgi:hypothetical protein
MIEFKDFPKMLNIEELEMHITQKINGTGVLIHVFKGPFKKEMNDAGIDLALTHPINDADLRQMFPNKTVKLVPSPIGNPYSFVWTQETILMAGSQNRWLTPDDDNFGFANFVEENKIDLIDALGEGTHYGEWAGPDIKNGEGLKEKTLFLFDWWKYDNKLEKFNGRVKTVPLLYSGKLDLSMADSIMETLKNKGSFAAEGFMDPEGIVISFAGLRFKKVFREDKVQ